MQKILKNWFFAVEDVQNYKKESKYLYGRGKDGIEKYYGKVYNIYYIIKENKCKYVKIKTSKGLYFCTEPDLEWLTFLKKDDIITYNIINNI